MVNIHSEPLDFDCKKGEAIFYKQMDEIITESEFSKIVAEFQSYLKRLALLNDDRLYALVANLLVENMIDNYFAEIMPKYSKSELSKKIDFTVSLKIDVAKELRFSPPKLFNGAKVINQIRNDFAHNLEITKFDDLKEKRINDIYKILNSYTPRSCLLRNRPLRERFSSLVLETIIGLNFNLRQVHMLNLFIREDQFYENLRAYCNDFKR
jgi:hypothetical protein